jgi:tryptophanyl-tRNA synthetase
MNAHLAPFRQRREVLAERPQDVWDILADGAQRANRIASQTMAEVRQAIGLP